MISISFMAGMSRRDFFKRFMGAGIESNVDDDSQELVSSPDPIIDDSGEDLVAVIQAKYCLAYEEIPCRACSDECPEPNVIVLEDELPKINVSGCTGCRQCQEVCPASADAILMVKRFGDETTRAVW